MPLSKQSISQAIKKTYEQSCHCGESAHPPTIWPGFDFLTHRYMWPEFVASLLCSEMFSLNTPVLPFHQKPAIAFI